MLIVNDTQFLDCRFDYVVVSVAVHDDVIAITWRPRVENMHPNNH